MDSKGMYLSLSVGVQSSVMTCLPVEQLHSRAESPAARVGEGGGESCIEEAVGHEAPQLAHPVTPSDPALRLTLQLISVVATTNPEGRGSLSGPSPSSKKHSTFAPKAILDGHCR